MICSKNQFGYIINTVDADDQENHTTILSQVRNNKPNALTQKLIKIKNKSKEHNCTK